MRQSPMPPLATTSMHVQAPIPRLKQVRPLSQALHTRFRIISFSANTFEMCMFIVLFSIECPSVFDTSGKP